MSGFQPLADALRDFYLKAHRATDRLMTRQGASLARTKLLLFIDRSGGVRSTDIASHFSYAPRTVTEAIDALERDGLVQREPDPTDRRAKRITITGAGRAAIEKSEPLRRRFFDDVFSVLDDRERADLEAMLIKLNARMDG